MTPEQTLRAEQAAADEWLADQTDDWPDHDPPPPPPPPRPLGAHRRRAQHRHLPARLLTDQRYEETATVLTTAATARLQRQLHELPELLVHAHLRLLPSGGGSRVGHVSGATRTPPLPCNLSVLDDLVGPDGPAVDILESWACTVLDDRARANDWTAWTVLPAIRGEIAASTAVKLLTYHLPFAASRAYAADLAAEIDTLHRDLDRIARHPIRSARPVRTPCPACQLLALCERTDGWRECLGCRSEFSPDAYANCARQLLAELDAAA